MRVVEPRPPQPPSVIEIPYRPKKWWLSCLFSQILSFFSRLVIFKSLFRRHPQAKYSPKFAGFFTSRGLRAVYFWWIMTCRTFLLEPLSRRSAPDVSLKNTVEIHLWHDVIIGIQYVAVNKVHIKVAVVKGYCTFFIVIASYLCRTRVVRTVNPNLRKRYVGKFDVPYPR